MTFNYKEYARQMRTNAVKNENGIVLCSPELWEEIANIIEDKPPMDFVKVETVKAWLLQLAKMNESVVLDGNFSSACEELAANIDELRKFAEGGVIDGKHKQNT